ncbi:uncharacterized protein LOC62_02G003313 [Vanrija pseudolonga]|uniref:Uncharacterized protein n=1 Tax=Vanrija pseudolonga TaxID=143232 RepID=A0AAF1BH60_9TREE|nr:hypothetical protein LOC62_02G003313 [Vanrija pseudolonga]
MPSSTRPTKRSATPANPPAAKKPKVVATNGNKRAASSGDTREAKKAKIAAPAPENDAGQRVRTQPEETGGATLPSASSAGSPEAVSTLAAVDGSNASTPEKTPTAVTTPWVKGGADTAGDTPQLLAPPKAENTLGAGAKGEVEVEGDNVSVPHLTADGVGKERDHKTAQPKDDVKADVTSGVEAGEEAQMAQEQPKTETEANLELLDGSASEGEVDAGLDAETSEVESKPAVAGDAKPDAKPKAGGDAESRSGAGAVPEMVATHAGSASSAGMAQLRFENITQDRPGVEAKAEAAPPSHPTRKIIKPKAPTTPDTRKVSPAAACLPRHRQRRQHLPLTPQLAKLPKAKPLDRVARAEEALNTAHAAWQAAIPPLRAAEPVSDRTEVVWLRATSIADAARVKLKKATQALEDAELRASVARVVAEVACATCTAEHSIACRVAAAAAKDSAETLEDAKADEARARETSSLAETELGARLAAYKAAIAAERRAKESLETAYQAYQDAVKGRREAGYAAH